MGLGLVVGLFALARDLDRDARNGLRVQFQHLNKALAAVGLPPHHEPENLAAPIFESELRGYSGLHHLRRLAASDALVRGLPEPGAAAAVRDPVVQAYYDRLSPPDTLHYVGQLLFRAESEQLPYQHLMLHSDQEGYYLPLDFEEVLLPAERLHIAGGMVGSAPRLLGECRALAAKLALPPELDPGSEELQAAAESPNSGRPVPGAPVWHSYGIESFCCLHLIRACEAAVGSGAALCFRRLTG